jgi:hypothetical protein
VSLLREIQEGAVGTDVPVDVLLRQCLVLAARLQHEPLRDWAKRELEGYPPDVALPPYRPRFATQVLGNLDGGFGKVMTNAGLAPASVPEAVRERLFMAEIRQGVAEIEQLLAGGEGTFSIPWPMNAVAALQSSFWENMNLIDAHQVIPAAVLIKTLSGIRDRVVQFALEIEAENPDAGEAAHGTVPVPEATVTNIFNSTIYGGQNTIAGAGRDTTVSVSHTRVDAVWPELQARLAELGVPEPDLDELAVALKSDGDPTTELGPATQSWLSQLTAKVASGSIALGQSVSVELIVHELLKAFGVS